jgi:mRNA-degrading endonuclease RelE of RelBE toxin-antitoxin system
MPKNNKSSVKRMSNQEWDKKFREDIQKLNEADQQPLIDWLRKVGQIK